LSDAERESLVESIRTDGVRYPVLLDRAGLIIDGNHRSAICAEFGIECPTITLDVDDGTAERLRITLNTARRQLSVKDRRLLTIELRAQGRSTRQIGEQVGVSEKTVRNDLSTADRSAVDPLPDTVVGRDGKRRKATTPSRDRPTGRPPSEQNSADQRTQTQNTDVAELLEDKAVTDRNEIDSFWRRFQADMAMTARKIREATGEIGRTGLPRSGSGEIIKKARALVSAIERFEQAAGR
jgi:ParB-like chromosome segregation protein Spo0J